MIRSWIRSSGVWKYTRQKIGKFSRTFRSIILEAACKYLKSIRFYKGYRTDFYRKLVNFSQRKTSCFILWPTHQNSSNFLHLCINSITIYPKSRAEADIQRCFFKRSSQTQRCYFEQLICFFPRKIDKKLPSPEPLFCLIIQAVSL